MIQFDTNGSFERYAKRLQEAASRMDSELLDSIRDDLKDVGQAVERRAASILPKRGGLARQVSAMTLSVTRKGSAATLTVRSDFNLDRLDQGSVIHPVYGRPPLVRQAIPDGFWSNVIRDAIPRIQSSLNKTLDRVIKDL